MDYTPDDQPRPESIILLLGVWFFNATYHLTHAEVNLWIATTVGLLGIDHYMGWNLATKFRLWCNKTIDFIKKKYRI